MTTDMNYVCLRVMTFARSARACLRAPCPREAWTHEGASGVPGCSASVLASMSTPDRGHVRRYNEGVGGVNDDGQGYHDSITRAYVAGVRLFLSETGETGLAARVNAMLLSDVGRRDWPLRFYSRELLFSVAARRRRAGPRATAASRPADIRRAFLRQHVPRGRDVAALDHPGVVEIAEDRRPQRLRRAALADDLAVPDLVAACLPGQLQ